MGVLVIHHRIRMLALRIEAQQNVVLVCSAQEQPAQLELSSCQILRWLQPAEILFVFDGQHGDGTQRIDWYLREQCVEDGAHALELIGYAAGLLFIRIADYGEVRTAYLDPDFRLIPTGCQQWQEEGREQRKTFRHIG